MAPNKKTSTKAAKDAGKKDSLSPNDQRLLNIAWACLLEKQIDINKFTELSGYANISSARVCWGLARRRIEAHIEGLTDNNGSSPRPAQTPSGSKRKDADTGNATTDDVLERPAPKKRKAAASANAEGSTGDAGHGKTAQHAPMGSENAEGTDVKFVLFGHRDPHGKRAASDDTLA